MRLAGGWSVSEFNGAPSTGCRVLSRTQRTRPAGTARETASIKIRIFVFFPLYFFSPWFSFFFPYEFLF